MNLSKRPDAVHTTSVQSPQAIQMTTLITEGKHTYPDRKRSILTANSTAAVGTAWFGRAPILLFLLENFWIEFLHKWEATNFITAIVF